MKTTAEIFIAALFFANSGHVMSTVRYVDVNGSNATPAYTDWATAATNNHDGVDAAALDDQIIVTNGIYATG
jgi:hypothetical protein